MRQIAIRVAFVALFLASLAAALPHGDDEGMDMNMDMDMGKSMDAQASATSTAPAASTESAMSYFAYQKHTNSIIAHIALMVVGWCFVLPAGKPQPRSCKLQGPPHPAYRAP